MPSLPSITQRRASRRARRGFGSSIHQTQFTDFLTFPVTRRKLTTWPSISDGGFLIRWLRSWFTAFYFGCGRLSGFTLIDNLLASGYAHFADMPLCTAGENIKIILSGPVALAKIADYAHPRLGILGIGIQCDGLPLTGNMLGNFHPCHGWEVLELSSQ